jgi:hypothetical protein
MADRGLAGAAAAARNELYKPHALHILEISYKTCQGLLSLPEFTLDQAQLDDIHRQMGYYTHRYGNFVLRSLWSVARSWRRSQTKPFQAREDGAARVYRQNRVC